MNNNCCIWTVVQDRLYYSRAGENKSTTQGDKMITVLRNYHNTNNKNLYLMSCQARPSFKNIDLHLLFSKIHNRFLFSKETVLMNPTPLTARLGQPVIIKRRSR